MSFEIAVICLLKEALLAYNFVNYVVSDLI